VAAPQGGEAVIERFSFGGLALAWRGCRAVKAGEAEPGDIVLYGPVSTYGLDDEFPLLWAAAKNADDDERLGLRVGQGDDEAARAMRELWDARRDADERRR
jgi:hypothetical protein